MVYERSIPSRYAKGIVNDILNSIDLWSIKWNINGS